MFLMEYTSSAFLAFKSNVPFSNVLKIFNPIKDYHLGITENQKNWNVNLFRIEHFQNYPSITNAYEIISQISANPSSRIDNPYLIKEIISSYMNAKRIYRTDPDMRSIVDIVKSHNMNYIMHGTYNGVFELTPFAQGKSISDVLFGIDNQLIFTNIFESKETKKKRVYGYRKKDVDHYVIG
ncbi:MAG TPA: hypothetical protein VEC16_03920 [Alphaproteobacteria bacterium]|nr:hypothetical protein [Alphaproteobacteria bacterium]